MALFDNDEHWAELKASLQEGLNPNRKSIMETVLQNQKRMLIEDARIKQIEQDAWNARPRWMKIRHWVQHRLFKLGLRKSTPYARPTMDELIPIIRRIIP